MSGAPAPTKAWERVENSVCLWTRSAQPPMNRSVDETRREFLVRLAQASAFVAPTVHTLTLPRAVEAQGGGKDPCQRRRPPKWCLSPTAQVIKPGMTFDAEPPASDIQQGLMVAPWDRDPPGSGR